jgi:hypothetical protein
MLRIPDGLPVASLRLCLALSATACSSEEPMDWTPTKLGEGDSSEPGDDAPRYEGDDPGECSDGADNDQDGLFDCDDDDCAGSPDCDGVDTDEPDDTGADDTGEVPSDLDNDGYSVEDGDCDDDDGAVHPGAEEVCGDGVDNDCDGAATGCGLEGELVPDDALAVLRGEQRGIFGKSLAAVGDFNGDGTPDLITGDEQFDNGPSASPGAAFIFHGPLSGEQSSANADVRMFEGQYGRSAGWWVSGAGDIDGDGYDDALIGAINSSYAAQLAGAVYVVHGPGVASMSLEDADAVLLGEATDDDLGERVRPGGDLDGDGTPEVVVSSESHDSSRGVVYIFGTTPSGVGSVGGASIQLTGAAAGQEFGKTYAGCDATGDGIDDLWVGSFKAGAAQSGAVHLFEGPVTANATSSNADHTITGEAASDHVGYRMECAHDISDDGKADMIVTAPTWNGGDGAAYVVYGAGLGISTMASADARIYPTSTGQEWGLEPAIFDDVTGDGQTDFGVGSHTANGNSGEAHVFSGRQSGVLGPADAVAHFSGEGASFAGLALEGMSDMDGDGHNEVLVGAYLLVHSETSSGAIYVLEAPGL